jgi:hypothetical protein
LRSTGKDKPASRRASCCRRQNRQQCGCFIPALTITAIVNGTRGISGETALRLARYFGTTPEYWMNLQKHYELNVAQDEFEAKIRKEIRPRQSEACIEGDPCAIP